MTIHTIDHIAAMMAYWMRNGSMKPEDILVAMCWDLSDAYKQVPLSDDAFDLDSYLAAYDPNSESSNIQKECFAIWVSSIISQFQCFPQSLTCHMEDRDVFASTLVVGILR